jgi:hypothetical protein
LYHIVVGNKVWCLHFDPETKHVSQHWKHPSYFSPAKNHTIPSAGKVMLTMSFNHCGPLLIDWLLKDITVSASFYGENLEHLRSTIKAKRPGMLSCGINILHDLTRPQSARTTCRSCSCFSGKFFDVPPTVQMCPPLTIMY